MKLYKVPVYYVSYCRQVKGLLCGNVYKIDEIIVKKNLIGVQEVLTDYSKFSVVPISAVRNGKLSSSYWKKKKNGLHCFVIKQDLCNDNQVKSEDLDDYINNYVESKWKETYDSYLRKDSKKEKLYMKQQIREFKEYE